MKILDTDHCIALFRGQLKLQDHVAPDEPLMTTALNIGELIHGAHKSANRRQNLALIEVLQTRVAVLPFDIGAAHNFGRLKAQLEQNGMRLPDIDVQIAGIALNHDLTLVTHNQRHFSRIPELTLEDWLA